MSGHIDDLELTTYVLEPDALTPERQAEIQRHTGSCEECGKRLELYSVAEEDFRDPGVWSELAEPLQASLPAAVRAFTNQCAAEDADADVLLAPFFGNPAKAMFANLPKQREFLTPGVVRRLTAEAHRIAHDKAESALIFADVAQAVANRLPDDIYPGNAVYELRGTAWKERANALLVLGRLDEALESLRFAERAYRQLTFPATGLAAVDLVRASVYYQLEQLDSATQYAERAEHAYANLDQQRRRMKAIYLRGTIQYESLNLENAARLFQQLIDFGHEENDPTWIATGSYSLANCELDRGNIANASMLFHSALVIFREIGSQTYRVATEWGLARVVLHSGKPADAARRLREAIRAFEDMGRVMEVAFAGLDLADALWLLEQPRQIANVAAHSFKLLQERGIVTAALTALAYLKEAAAKGHVDPQLIQHVREFLRRTQRNPELLFVPPPDPLG